MSYRETVYLGRDNDIPLALAQGDDIIDASGVTRCQLFFKRPGETDVLIDSNTSPAMFDLSEKGTVNGIQAGILVLKLGEASTLDEDLYDVDVYLFDAANDAGIFWATLEIQVKDGDA